MGTSASSLTKHAIDADVPDVNESVVRQRLAGLRLTSSGALTAVTKELSTLRRQLAVWVQGMQTPPEPVVHIPQSHTSENGVILQESDLTFVSGEGYKMLSPWPALDEKSAQDPAKQVNWISERVTQMLVYLDNIVIQQQDHMRQHRRSLVRQLQLLSSDAQLRLMPAATPHRNDITAGAAAYATPNGHADS